MSIFRVVHPTAIAIQTCLLALIRRAWIIILPLAVASGGDHQWSTGKVLDSAISRDLLATSIGYHSQAHFIGNARSLVASSSVDRTTFWDKQVIVQGGSYWYAVDDLTLKAVGLPLPGLINRAVANRKHGCRMVGGDPIQYAQEKGKLIVLDADGKECKLDIIRQERIPDIATVSSIRLHGSAKPDNTESAAKTLKLDSTILPVSSITKSGSHSDKPVPLHDADILQMMKAGVNEQVILAKIQSSPGMYELGTDDLWRLKAAGVSEKVMMAMMSALHSLDTRAFVPSLVAAFQ